MIRLKFMNNDKIKKYNSFPISKDPYILEKTLLRISNEYFMSKNQSIEYEFDINNPKISNLYFSYYSTSNFNIWGHLPLNYIYNDMISHIKNLNTSNNFIVTIESIDIDLNNDFSTQAVKMYLIYEILESYIVENYTISYNYMTCDSNCVMVAYIPKGYNKFTAYIVSSGFDPINMAKWYNSSQNSNDPNALPYNRYTSLYSIKNTYEYIYGINIGIIDIDCSNSRVFERIDNCINEVKKYDINSFKKKSIYDTNIKYGNYKIDYNLLNLYNNSMPACTMIYNNMEINRFNQEGEYKTDFRLLEKQNELIKINKKLQIKERANF